jgi:hypothetical protein
VTLVEGQSSEGQELADRIAATLKESCQLSGYRVGVQCEDGVVWLLGTVTDQQQMQAAIELTEQVDGVEHVVSKLEIVAAAPRAVAPKPKAARESAPSMRIVSLDASIEGPASSRPVANRGNVRPAAASQPAPRGGMPMPLGKAQADAVRQASYAGSGVQQASCGPGCGPGGFGHGGFGPGGVPGAAGYVPGATGGVVYDNAQMPAYSWPSYAAYPNYAALTYPQQYSPTAWPYIGPFYPYPQVPLGWRRVTLEWDDGWWWLDFSHRKCH